MPQKQPTVNGPKALTYTHEAMADLIISDPTVTCKELAEVFNLSVGWVSRVLASNLFQTHLAARKSALIDPALRNDLEERLRAMVLQACDILQRRMSEEDSVATALSALECATQLTKDLK